MNPHVKSNEDPVSRCLEDALEAALRGAFEVALEIAVNEVGKLMGQALRDVRDQIHETQQENITLKLRLQQLTAEPNQSGFGSDSLDGDISGNACEKQRSGDADGYAVNGAKINCEKMHESFQEIGDDGLLRSHEILNSANDDNNTSDQEEELRSGHVDSSDQDSSSSSSSCHPVFEDVKVKNEKSEPQDPVLDGSSGCGSDPRPDCSLDQRSAEVIELERIALAQFKLLEDWRPDSEDPEGETEPLDQASNHGTTELSLSSSGSVPLFPAPFDVIYQSADKTCDPQPPPNSGDPIRTNVPHSSVCVCDFCGLAFHSGGDLRTHHSQYHKTVVLRKGSSATRSRKQKQQLFPPGCSPYHCNVCNREFNRMENLKTHLRIHTGERPYTCSVCGVRFRHAGALTRHFRIHTGEKPYVCAECGKSFRNCGGLRFHQKSHSQAVHALRK